MATIWAKQSGNWNDSSLWAFWNENTQQIDDYGRIPQADDVVFCNGYDVYLDEGFAVQEVRNDRNPHTSRSGGQIYVQTTATASVFIINADLIGSGTILRVLKNSTNWTINGNVTGCSFYCPNNTTTMTFNGNCESLGFSKSGSLTHTLNFNGTLSIISRNLFSQNSYIITVRRLIQSFLIQPSTAGVSGVLNVVDEYIPVGSFQSNVNIQLDGHLNLSQSNAQKPSDVIDGNHTLNLKGLISTIDQKTDYPQPEDVRKNIAYDFGQMVGTMEQTITSTNTINVYPYKRRR